MRDQKDRLSEDDQPRPKTRRAGVRDPTNHPDAADTETDHLRAAAVSPTFTAVALVGRTNVGKSALFNRLTRSPDAIVGKFRGLTRDRRYGILRIDREVVVADTAGIDCQTTPGRSSANPRDRLPSGSFAAIEDSRLVLLVVDGRSGPLPGDRFLAEHLRTRRQKTIVVVNKIEQRGWADLTGEFYSLGLREICPVSASSGSNIDRLMHRISSLLAGEKMSAENHLVDQTTFGWEGGVEVPKIVVIGRSNVGKSTLVNSLLGGEHQVVLNSPGTTRDSITLPAVLAGRRYAITDTAGADTPRSTGMEALFLSQSRRALRNADQVLLVFEADKGVTNQDLRLLELVLRSGKSVAIAVNKLDKLPPGEIARLKEEVDSRLRFAPFVQRYFISALSGAGMEDLDEFISLHHDPARIKINTTLLTRAVRTAVVRSPPPRVSGRQIRLKYAHVGCYRPLILVIHGSGSTLLPLSYRKYLVNFLRRCCLPGQSRSIFLKFKDGDR